MRREDDGQGLEEAIACLPLGGQMAVAQEAIDTLALVRGVGRPWQRAAHIGQRQPSAHQRALYGADQDPGAGRVHERARARHPCVQESNAVQAETSVIEMNCLATTIRSHLSMHVDPLSSCYYNTSPQHSRGSFRGRRSPGADRPLRLEGRHGHAQAVRRRGVSQRARDHESAGAGWPHARRLLNSKIQTIENRSKAG